MVNRKKSRNILGVVALLVILAMLTGCQEKYKGNPDNSSTSCGNIVMGNGKFAYCNEFIYFTDRERIYEYDMTTNSTIAMDAKSEDVRSIYIQDKFIYFACDGLKRISKDGKKVQQVFEREGGCLQLYIENENAYFLEGIEGNLYQRNLEDDTETEILANVLSYYVDETNIYAVAKQDEVSNLYISKKDKIDFAVQELSFIPVAVLATPDGIYLSERQTFQIIKFTSEGEERLPIYGTYYQIIGDKVIYLDSKAYENSCFDLVTYNMATGEKTTLYEEVYDFNILNEKYICVQQRPVQSVAYYMYNLETGENLSLFEKGK